jgi:sugar phosphate permease
VLAAFLVAGLFVAPSVVASYLVADEAVQGASAESTAWVTAAFNVGTAAGTLLAGLLVDVRSASVAMLALALTTVVIATAGALGVRRAMRA